MKLALKIKKKYRIKLGSNIVENWQEILQEIRNKAPYVISNKYHKKKEICIEKQILYEIGNKYCRKLPTNIVRNL